MAQRRLHSVACHVLPFGAGSAAETPDGPVFTLAEVAKHRSRQSAWVALYGEVYDFTPFLDQHPGGARGLLRYAGTDASDAFTELHTANVFAAFAPRYRIGRLGLGQEGASTPPAAQRASALPISNFADSALDSAFPHERFEGTGLEAFRFQWAALDQLVRADKPSQDALDTRFAHRQKSYIAPLENWERDWLHVGAPEQYVPQMKIRLQLFREEESRSMVYVSDATLIGKSVSVGAARGDSRPAQREVLGQMLEWLPRRYPTRFRVDGDPYSKDAVVHTTTPGYEHSFAVLDFWDEAMRLCGLIVQEDMYLLREEDATLPLDYHEDSTLEYHAEDHPSGVHHIFVAGASTFSFDAVPKFMRPMSTIHHPNVPGFWLHLQRGMNRLFAEMQPGVPWTRHNYAFEDERANTHCCNHGKPFAKFIQPALLRANREKPGLIPGTDGEVTNEDVAEDSMAAELGLEKGVEYVRNRMSLRVEYQTLQRLPESRHIFFTVRTYIDRLSNLEECPGAAKAVAAAVRRKYKGMMHYMGVGRESSQQAILGYLDQIAGEAILSGRVREPWERESVEDGTFAAETERLLRAGGEETEELRLEKAQRRAA